MFRATVPQRASARAITLGVLVVLSVMSAFVVPAAPVSDASVQSTTGTSGLSVAINGTTSPVKPGGLLEVTATVENTGNETIEQDVSLDIGDVRRDTRSVTLEPGDAKILTLTWEPGLGDAGEYTATVASDTDADSTTVVVADRELADGGTYWQGQWLATDAYEPGETVELRRSDGSLVAEHSVDAEGVVSFDTTSLDADEYVLTDDETAFEFELAVQTLSLSWNRDSVATSGNNTTATLAVESNRRETIIDLTAAVDGDLVTPSTIQNLTGGVGTTVDTDDDGEADSLRLEGTDLDELSFDFDDVPEGEFTLTSTVPDSTAEAWTAIAVTASTEELDFGDASDPPYPTTRANDGARHRSAWPYVLLGQNVSYEYNPRTTDTYDDGVTWISEDTIEVTVKLDGRGSSTSEDVFVNVLFDRHGDARWDISSDWVVRNEEVRMDTGSGTVDVQTLRLDVPSSGCDYPHDDTWMRVTVTSHPLQSYDGSGFYSEGGETEDYEIGASGCADLSVNKTANVSTIGMGDDVQYTLEADNDGSNASTVEVEDDLPDCMDVVSTSGPGRYDSASNTWTVQLDADETATLSLTVAVTCHSGVVTNTATIIGDGIDPDTSNNDDDATVTVIGPDVAVEKAANRSTVTSTQEVTYSLHVTNNGRLTTVVDVADDLPDCMEFVAATGPSSYDSGTNTWTVELDAGESAELDLTVTVDCPPGFETNTATLVDHYDRDPSNDEDSMTVEVEPAPADLHLNKTTNTSAVVTGNRVTYSLALTNEGPGPTTAEVVDDLPDCVDVDSTTGPGSYDGTTWTVALQPNESATLQLHATVDCEPGYVTNNASVTGNVTDPDPTNNEVNATVTVLTDWDAEIEFGDAPDPPYSTTIRNDGPYTGPVYGEAVLYLGDDVSYESAPNLANEDEYDDGFVENETTPDQLALSITNDPTVTAPPQERIYVNVFVDLNDDGDWQDPDEWAVNNSAVIVNGTRTVTFQTSTPVRAYLNDSRAGGYTRVMVTPGNVKPSRRGGLGNHHWGEIEDYSQDEMTDVTATQPISVPGFTGLEALAALVGLLLASRRWH